MAPQTSPTAISLAPSSENAQHQRDRYKSPPPPPDSMTPPPSSRAPTLASAAPLISRTRTPTPTPTQLSSPPRTNHRQRSADYGLFTAAQVEAASSEEKNDMLLRLAAELREARAAAAHYRLQNEWAQIEADKAVETMGVELDMANREMHVLRQQARGPRSTSDEQQLTYWREQCAVHETQHNASRQHFERHSAELRYQLTDRDDRLAAALTEVAQLRERIRDNRAHMNLWRERSSHESSTLPLPQTPLRQTAPRDMYQTPISKPRGSEGLAALLLATDREYRHEVASSPSSPVPRDLKRTPAAHRRGSQSLSSIQSTPYATKTTQQTVRAPPTRYYGPPSHSQSSPVRQPHVLVQQHRRRVSRDSTISAGESDDEHRRELLDERHVYESQASQAATEMLRKSASSSLRQDEPASQGSTNRNLAQSEPYSKAGFAKRKAMDDGASDVRSPKKTRAMEGVGLGIDGWVPS